MTKHPKKKSEKIEKIKRICELVKEMEIDEQKAEKEYNEVISVFQKKHPEYVSELEKILSDEISHAITLTNIGKKIKCK